VRTLISHFFPNHPDASLYTVTDDTVRHDPPRLDQQFVRQLAEMDPIWAERGKAIQSYAQLEQSLCFLMETLGDMPKGVAPIIFYKITSAKARAAIIDKMLARKYGHKYNLFWNAYLKSLHPIDTKRNEIVHWLSASVGKLNEDGKICAGVVLVPPNFHAYKLDSPRLRISELQQFSEKCEIYWRLCNTFCIVNHPDFSEEKADAWLHIFQQPFLYPLPEDHLLYKSLAT
jgi:hypothetical protein